MFAEYRMLVKFMCRRNLGDEDPRSGGSRALGHDVRIEIALGIEKRCWQRPKSVRLSIY